MQDLIRKVEQEYVRPLSEFIRARDGNPDIFPGDTVRVNVRIVEGNRERIQAFEGVVLRKHRNGLGSTFTVRRVTYGVGVERTFPLYSPRIESIEVLRRGSVRRAKLYYLRDRVGKAARIREKTFVRNKATESSTD
ncbi:MAG: 50S ribosomal protein L19 [Candidatus Poribacteria bacterium]|nr:MAG: 50S ribosomal protein L19 [Candidatus Poribacteria bacterium]